MLDNRTRCASGMMVVALAVGGCATKYQSASGGGGYMDYRITTDVFAVSFRGNVGTCEDTVESYVLRRASNAFVVLRVLQFQDPDGRARHVGVDPLFSWSTSGLRGTHRRRRFPAVQLPRNACGVG